MCSPTIAVAAMATSTAVSAYGKYQSGKYNEAVAGQNAQLAEVSAEDALARGATRATQYRTQVKKFLGQQRVAIAANGIEASGSALHVMADTATQGELNALTIRNNAAREAFGYRVQGMNYKAQGQMDRYAGTYGAIGTVLGGGANAYGAYKQWGG